MSGDASSPPIGSRADMIASWPKAYCHLFGAMGDLERLWRHRQALLWEYQVMAGEQPTAHSPQPEV